MSTKRSAQRDGKNDQSGQPSGQRLASMLAHGIPVTATRFGEVLPERRRSDSSRPIPSGRVAPSTPAAISLNDREGAVTAPVNQFSRTEEVIRIS